MYNEEGNFYSKYAFFLIGKTVSHEKIKSFKIYNT